MITEDNLSTEFSPKNEIIDKDQRRLLLLNDSNYGIVLCFLEKFRSILDLPNYSLQRFEDHLINYEERNSVPPRLIDFHFILLKRLSLAKNTQREKFDSIITKFASRFDLNDSNHLSTTGYLQAEINVKVRILKNLLESQFDLNQTFKNTLVDKTAREIKSIPLGRDRFGMSYWLFMDTDCFVRLFREDADIDRTWTNVAKDRNEFESFIKLLITDSVVRAKFSDWTVDYEPFSSLSPSDEFEKCYLPSAIDMKEEDIKPIVNDDEKLDESIKKKRGRPKGSVNSIKNEKPQIEMEIEQEEEEETEPVSTDDEKPDIPIKRKRGRPKGSINSPKKEIKQEKEEEEEKNEPMSHDDDDDEKPNEPIKKKRGRPKGSIKSLTNVKNQVYIEIKEEKHEVELTLNHNQTNDMLTKRKPGRPKSLTKEIDMNIKEEEIEYTSIEYESIEESIKKKRGRPRGSVKSVSNTKNQIELEIKNEPNEQVITTTRRGRKRKIITEDNNNNENSKIEDNDQQHEESFIDDANLSIRRSSRPRKAPTIEPTSVLTSKTISQV
ncbi:unnamed protein product [Rotaria sp. Silwood1]|nr:unnamed protein product [Rotaria sp. Silwood1]CAF3579402.1 unnamed protein product [Rotaria sp. Silwood1]CAF4831317.1 unnamed protein product [Rotaria sp. Silwood1]